MRDRVINKLGSLYFSFEKSAWEGIMFDVHNLRQPCQSDQPTHQSQTLKQAGTNKRHREVPEVPNVTPISSVCDVIRVERAHRPVPYLASQSEAAILTNSVLIGQGYPAYSSGDKRQMQKKTILR